MAAVSAGIQRRSGFFVQCVAPFCSETVPFVGEMQIRSVPNKRFFHAMLASRRKSSSVDSPAVAFRSVERRGHGRYYTKTHEWFEVVDEGVGTVGITQAAQRALGEVVFCRLPKVGDRFSVMETLATLEAVKTVGEVKSPVYGEVIEVNPRLEREPALATFAPLTDGWLVRLAFSGQIPRYLRSTRAVSRADVEHLLADLPALREWLAEHLLATTSENDNPNTTPALKELTFEGLNSMERLFVHRSAQEIGLESSSRGAGPGRQLVVRRPAPPEESGVGSDEEFDEVGSPLSAEDWLEKRAQAEGIIGLERSPGPRGSARARGSGRALRRLRPGV